ncbi:MAG: phage tail protein [Gammaproteobacteria bacterium]|nr:phage tail protein [Gammaproteobacteria bacterium]
MKKLALLRQTILDCGLNIQPEDVTAMVKRGKVISHYNRPDDNGNEKLKLQYDGTLLIMDFTGDIAALAYIISQWLRQNQPHHAPDCLKYEVDILNHNECDVVFTLSDLSETVTASETKDGKLIDSCPATHTDAIIRREGITELEGKVVQPPPPREI